MSSQEMIGGATLEGQSARPALLWLPGLLHPRDMTEDNPYGNYQQLVQEFTDAGIDIKLIYPDWNVDEIVEEVPEYRIMGCWHARLGEAVLDLVDAGRDFWIAGHSMGANEVVRYVGTLANGLWRQGTPLKGVFLFSPAPFDGGEVANIYDLLYGRGMYRQERSLIPESFREEIEAATLPLLHSRNYEVHVTCGADELPLNNLRSWLAASLGSEETQNRTFEALLGIFHNVAEEPAYTHAAVRIVRSAIEGTIFEERAPLHGGGKMLNLSVVDTSRPGMV